jgi:hypothetical protein
MFLPEEARCRYKSNPVIIGMLMSTIRHDVRAKYAESRKCLADAKVCTVNPTDRMRLLSASRTESSSSTIDIRGFVGTPISGNQGFEANNTQAGVSLRS